MAERVNIEVAFALPDKQWLIELAVPEGSSARDAVELSDVRNLAKQGSETELAIGIWGTIVAEDHVVQDGDRVELYRPLARDPREARRMLAQAGQTMRNSETD